MESASIDLPPPPRETHRVAPWWMGYLFILPVRRLWEHPSRLMLPWVRPGDRVLELGCGMGFFTLDLARLVGPAGRVFCVDVEPRVLATLRHRAHRRRLLDRLEVRTCAPDDPCVDDLAGTIDVALAHHVIHETADPARALDRLATALRPEGVLYLAEPPAHVSPELFAWQLEVAGRAGLVRTDEPGGGRPLTAVLRKSPRQA